MKSIWGYLIALVCVAVAIGLLLPEILGAFVPDSSLLRDEIVITVPDPPWWVVLIATLTIALCLLYPSDQVYELADTRRKEDIGQTKKIMAYIIFIFFFLSSYLFIWAGWTLRNFPLG